MTKERAQKQPPLSPPVPAISREGATSDVLFFSIGEGAIVTDAHGKVSRINRVALEILGLKAREVLDKWYPDVVVAEDEAGKLIPKIERPITEVFLSGRPIFKRIYYRRKDGSRVPVAVTVSPIIVRGKPVGAIEVFRDITEEVELEKAKDEFISIASHQLRTPATVVKQYIGMMLDGYTGTMTKEQLTMLKTAYEYNDNQLKIINDLLRVAQADANKIRVSYQRVNVAKLINEVVTSQRGSYQEKKLKLVFEHPTSPVFCRIDPLHLRMVVENLLENSQKYSSPGKLVTVTLTNMDKNIRIGVKDEGIGIAQNDLSRLFQKFSRLNNPEASASGTGLGLYWAKKLVELHKGTINVISDLGKGSEFTIQLPKGEES